ncbi:phopshatase [Strigomonas culicis]|uniref:protein-tyrosine-phosphatase n=1 Tax=Strigomonas culicis TaxID=28005 RepID=S9WEX3_9TRYP|nr:phopshatase [Strigomonas culicis]|eukprot:EPY34285.1 phopshatase [Strigomonas culicis]
MDNSKAWCNFDDVTDNDVADGSDASTTSSSAPSSSKSSLSTSRIKKLSLQHDPENEKQEMEQEIEKSRASHDCNLSNLNLTTIPTNVPLHTLTKLSLSVNAITSLPSSLFEGKNCSALREFDAYSNSISSVPDSLFLLSNLEVLLLDHNQIDTLPLASAAASGKPLLPKVRRVGLEFNNLTSFPIELLERCRNLSELSLSNNERMFDNPVPFDRLLKCPFGGKNTTQSVLLRADNRPRFMDAVANQKWSTHLPWLTINFIKIYPDKVLDFMFLGSVRTAQTVTVYHDLDIKYVLTVGRGLEVVIEPGMHHLVFPIQDFPEENMSGLFLQAFDFIDAAREEKKGILIHCFAGLSRSVTIAAAYLMKAKHMTCDEAMQLIKQARPAARPNEGLCKSC